MNFITNRHCPIKIFPKCEHVANIIINPDEWMLSRERRSMIMEEFNIFHNNMNKQVYFLHFEVMGGMVEVGQAMTHDQVLQWMLRFQLPSRLLEQVDFDSVSLYPHPRPQN